MSVPAEAASATIGRSCPGGAPLRRVLAAGLAAMFLCGASAARADESGAEGGADAESGVPFDRRYLEEQLLDDETRAAIQKLIGALQPVMERFATFIGDLPTYEAPEILPNGDIIIRRKRPESPLEQDEVET